MRNPLVSELKLCRKGNEVTFRKDDGYIKNIMTGVITPFKVIGNAYILEMWIAPFPRQGK